MALTVPYAIKLAKALQPYNLKWMEEFLPPDDYAGCHKQRTTHELKLARIGRYAQVKDALKDTGILLTTGEHEYTRYGFRKLQSPPNMHALHTFYNAPCMCLHLEIPPGPRI